MKTYVGRGVGIHIEKLILSAKERLYVCCPFIGLKYAEKIVKLAKSGVEVKVITSQAGNNKNTIKFLLNALTPTTKFFGLVRDKTWKPPNLELIIAESQLINAKIYIVDNYAITGSVNLTESSLWRNIEYAIIFDNKEAKQIEKDYLALWDIYKSEKKGIQEIITLEDIAKKLGATVKDLFRKIK